MSQNQNLPAKNDIRSLMSKVNVKARFEEILGAKAAGFISSVVNVAQGNKDLRTMEDQQSILSAAVLAATLELPVIPSLGFAHIVPYKDKEGKPHAQFQVGWKGFVQLGMRTGQYKTMNCAEVYEGELVSYNRITGEAVFDLNAKISDKIVGYVAFFRLINGFEKYLYMPVEAIQKHGRKYSKSYNRPTSKWQQDFHSMALKTVMKLLLSKFGILSIEMQTAVQADQAVIKATDDDVTEFDFEYADNYDTLDVEGKVVDEVTETEKEFKEFKAQKGQQTLIEGEGKDVK